MFAQAIFGVMESALRKYTYTGADLSHLHSRINQIPSLKNQGMFIIFIRQKNYRCGVGTIFCGYFLPVGYYVQEVVLLRASQPLNRWRYHTVLYTSNLIEFISKFTRNIEKYRY